MILLAGLGWRHISFVMMRSGPLAPVPVTVAEVMNRAVSPALFGVGVVESGAVFRVGPTSPGRVRELVAQVGDRVEKGQKIAVMDPVDMDERISAQKASIDRLSASVKAAGQGRRRWLQKRLCRAQSKRYDNLLNRRGASTPQRQTAGGLATAAAWTSASAESGCPAIGAAGGPVCPVSREVRHSGSAAGLCPVRRAG